MVVTDDDDVAARLKLLRSHGMTTLTWDRHRGHASSYDVVALGYNYRIDEPRAALALSRLTRLERENEQRRTVVARYREAFASAQRFVVALAGGRPGLRGAPVHDCPRRRYRPRHVPRHARRAGHPDERALPARTHLLDLWRGFRRAACDVELRRADGDVAALRAHGRRAGRRRHRSSAPGRLSPRLFRSSSKQGQASQRSRKQGDDLTQRDVAQRGQADNVRRRTDGGAEDCGVLGKQDAYRHGEEGHDSRLPNNLRHGDPEHPAMHECRSPEQDRALRTPRARMQRLWNRTAG